MKYIWSLAKFPLEGWIIYKVSEFLETIAIKGGLSRFQESDIIHLLYDKVDDITRILLVALMIIYYVRKWSCKDKEKWHNDRIESLGYGIVGAPILGIIAGIIDRIALGICPMLRLSGKVDPSIYTIKRPLETFIVAVVLLILIEMRYGIFKWLGRKRWVGNIGFVACFVVVNIILHCISYGVFHMIYMAFIEPIIDVVIGGFVKLIFISIFCPGLLAAIYLAWPVRSK